MTTPARLTADQLRFHLGHFTGTESYHRLTLTDVVATDGVHFFAEQGGSHGAYWLLNEIAPVLSANMSYDDLSFCSITVTVADSKADIKITDGNTKVVWSKHIDFTDLQPGRWQFFCVDDGQQRVLMLPSEY